MNRKRLGEQYLSLVGWIAYGVSRSAGRKDLYDDLVSVGNIALIESSKRYSKDRGAKFRSYAWTRINGAMIDHLRGQHIVQKSVRKGSKNSPVLNIEYLREMAAEDRDVYEELDLSKTISCLSERQRQVISLYCYGDMSMTMIAEELGTSESSVRENFGKAVVHLRKALRLEYSEFRRRKSAHGYGSYHSYESRRLLRRTMETASRPTSPPPCTSPDSSGRTARRKYRRR